MSASRSSYSILPRTPSLHRMTRCIFWGGGYVPWCVLCLDFSVWMYVVEWIRSFVQGRDSRRNNLFSFLPFFSFLRSFARSVMASFSYKLIQTHSFILPPFHPSTIDPSPQPTRTSPLYSLRSFFLPSILFYPDSARARLGAALTRVWWCGMVVWWCGGVVVCMEFIDSTE